MCEEVVTHMSGKDLEIFCLRDLLCFTDLSGYEQLQTYIGSFYCEPLPNEVFNISVGVKSKTEFTIGLSKLSPQSAKATIFISIGKAIKVIKIDDWTNSWIFENIPCTFQSGERYLFVCEITWEDYHDTKLPSSVDLHRPIEPSLSGPDSTDLMIKIDDNEIPVHKLILTAHSPVFEAMFKTDMIESAKNEIVVEDIDFDVMKLFVEFMYSGKIDSKLPVDDLLCMLYVSEKYEIVNLKKMCEELLTLKMSVYNIFEIFEHAYLYRSHYLITSGVNFVNKNLHIVIQSEDFRKLCLSNAELSDIFTFQINK